MDAFTLALVTIIILSGFRVEATTFEVRENTFIGCSPKEANLISSEFRLTCLKEFPRICYQVCLKCGSGSLSRTFGRDVIHLSVRDCDFRGIDAILIFKRDIVTRFMSGYGQITFQGYKRKEKQLEAQRNKYALINPQKNPKLRLSLFLDAMENAEKRALIPDVGHMNQMFHTYQNLWRCFQLETRPSLFILDLENVKKEMNAVSGILNITLPNVKFTKRHSGAQMYKMKKCGKCQMQYAARKTQYSSDQYERILKLYRDDVQCFGD